MVTSRYTHLLLVVSVSLAYAETDRDTTEASADTGDSSSIAADTTKTPAGDNSEPRSQAFDADWEETIWTEIDHMMRQESLQLQKTVTTAGVRGAEAEDEMLEQLQFIDAPSRSTKESVGDAINALKGMLEREESLLEETETTDETERQRKLDGVAKKRLFIARSYEQLGITDSARVYYMSLTEQLMNTKSTEEASDLLDQLFLQGSPNSTSESGDSSQPTHK